MATTPEGWVKRAVKELLEYWGVYYHMPVQNGMGKPSLDFICCAEGRFLAVETKAPGKIATARQTATMNEMAMAGGVVLVVRDSTTFLQLREWLLDTCGPLNHVVPPDLRVKWERYFANAGCKDVDQPAT